MATFVINGYDHRHRGYRRQADAEPRHPDDHDRAPASSRAGDSRPPTAGDIPSTVLETTSITQAGSPVGAPRLVKVNETPTSVTIALEGTPPPSKQWTIDGADRGTSTTILIDLPPGANVAVRAGATTSVPQGEFTAYYRFDHPVTGSDNDTCAYAQLTDGPGRVRSTNTVPAADQGLTAPWPGGTDAAAALTPLLASLPDNTASVPSSPEKGELKQSLPRRQPTFFHKPVTSSFFQLNRGCN